MAQHQRDRILSAAIEMIARRGYAETTVDHIVAAAKIGVGTFYDQFGNKSDCLLEAYDGIVEAAAERIVAAVPAGLSWSQRMRAGLESLLTIIAEEPLRAKIALIEVQTAGAAGIERYEATLSRIVPLLEEGRAESAHPESMSPTLETAVLGGLAWFLQQRVATGGKSIDKSLPDVLEIVLTPYLGEAGVSALLANPAGARATSADPL